jgi:opacity protein-like surface antigen
MNKLLIITSTILLAAYGANAQDSTRKKTIDITSTFKPTLRTPYKIGFTASPAGTDSSRPTLQYFVPVQNLAFSFYPAPLKPLAYEDSISRAERNKAYVKLGFGNFTTPYFKGAVGFGDGIKSNGSLEGDFTSSKGKMPHQKFAQYGLRGSAILNVNEINDLRLNAGFQGLNTFRYGYQPETLQFPKDSLKLQYSDFTAGASFSNRRDKEAVLWYDPSVAFHFFADNQRAREIQFNFDVPLEKKLNDDITIQVGVSGMLDKFTADTSDVSNNLFMVNAGVKANITENIQVKAGLIPSFNNGNFKLLPNIETDFLLNGSSFVFQAGWKGYYTENTFRSLVAYNPWIAQPSAFTNTRNSEFYGAVKAVVDEHFSFRVKAGYVSMSDVPLFVNDYGDGRAFRLINEPKMNKVSVTGELTWQQADKFQWYNSVALNSFGGIDFAPKPYGLLPFELKSSARSELIKKLYLKADLYNFAGTWYGDKNGGSHKVKNGFDLNAGLEFNVYKNIDLWLQFNNILNQKYQRWNQYPVLGFQVLGGVIFHL